MAEKTYKCIAVMNNNVGSTTSIQVTSPTGNTIGLYLKKPPVTDLKEEESIDFWYIVGSIKRAIKDRAKWEEDNKPKSQDKTEWVTYSARLKNTQPPGMVSVYVYLTAHEMQLLATLRDRV